MIQTATIQFVSRNCKYFRNESIQMIVFVLESQHAQQLQRRILHVHCLLGRVHWIVYFNRGPIFTESKKKKRVNNKSARTEGARAMQSWGLY